MNNEYPKVCQSRTCRHSSVVVANAEQEAELPDDFRPSPASALANFNAADSIQHGGAPVAANEKRKYTRKE